MKTLHLHVNVENLEDSISFYETLFGTAPTVRKADYAKWLLDDPRVNLAISCRGRPAGLDHLGIEAGSAHELAEVAGRLKAAEQPVIEQEKATCCYAVSDKAWSVDPAGLSWETFHSTGEATQYGGYILEAEERLAFAAGQPAEQPVREVCCPAAGNVPDRDAKTERCC